MTGTNAVMNLTAYGRTMLVGGGKPYYGKSYVSGNAEFLEKYDEINSYFLENSTRKLSTVMVNGKSQNYKNYVFNDDGSAADTDGDGDIDDEGTRLGSASSDKLDALWYSDEAFDYIDGTWDGGYNEVYDREPSLVQKKSSDSGAISKDAVHNRSVIFVKDAECWVVLDKMTGGNKEKNKYSGIWNFAAYEDGNKVLTGYKESMVNIDEENNMIYTSDPNGPDLFIKCFSNRQLSFKKYFGYYEKGKIGLGWVNRGNFTELGNNAPRVDVHAEWEDNGNGDISLAAFLLTPSRNAENPVISYTDLSDNDGISFSAEFKNGMVLSFDAAKNRSDLSADGALASGKMMIAARKNGMPKKIMIVDDSIRVYEED